ncbi:hypothetical protein [Halorientalis litorea]|jgi:hypothetical protein|uniref:hypothetical protein n=1 Tax=Halorientalis litorea TaxID=2931977 RepID=UPI001FF12ED0|nr:hypothetical protein [Halorientalis litorea]
MVFSQAARILLDASIVLLIVASLVEVYIDVSDRSPSSFLPPVLARYPPSEPATAIALGGGVVFVLGFAVELAVAYGARGAIVPPGGRILIFLLALVSFLFAGGFVVDEDDAEPEVES